MKYKAAFFTLLLLTISSICGLVYVLNRPNIPSEATYYIEKNSNENNLKKYINPLTVDSVNQIMIIKEDTSYIVEGPMSVSIK